MSVGILGAAHTGITVHSLERSLAFWQDILGFEVAVRYSMSGEVVEQITGVPGGAIEFAILNIPGGHQVELVEYTAPAHREHLRPRPSDVGSLHLALYVENIQAVLRRVAAAGWQAAGTPQTMADGPAKGVTFVYMTDPDGTVVELIQAAA